MSLEGLPVLVKIYSRRASTVTEFPFYPFDISVTHSFIINQFDDHNYNVEYNRKRGS